jgi:hypothetical protein
MGAKYMGAIGLLCIGSFFATSVPILGQETADIPQVTIEVTTEGFSVPDEVPQGIVQVTVENNSETPIGPVFARLNDGVTPDDLWAVIKDGGDLAEQAAFERASVLGFLQLVPGETRDVIFDLTPGKYILLNWPGDVPDEIIPFTVTDTGSTTAAAPQADVEVTLVNFAFNVPITIPAGPQLWHISNRGDQPHEIIALPIDANMTVGDFNALLQGLFSGTVAPPAEPLFYLPMSPGEQAWISYDLSPGTYALLCGMPDTSGSNQLHVELGMRQIITVTG